MENSIFVILSCTYVVLTCRNSAKFDWIFKNETFLECWHHYNAKFSKSVEFCQETKKFWICAFSNKYHVQVLWGGGNSSANDSKNFAICDFWKIISNMEFGFIVVKCVSFPSQMTYMISKTLTRTRYKLTGGSQNWICRGAENHVIFAHFSKFRKTDFTKL